MNKWTSYSLANVANLLDCLHKTPAYSDSGYPIVRVTDIKKGYLKLDSCLKVDERNFKLFSKQYVPQKGDIVFSRVGSYGISSLVRHSQVFCIGQNTVLIIPKKINGEFLFYYLTSSDAFNQIEGLVAGSTQPTISMKSIREIEVPFPPLPEQERIAEILSSLDDKIDLLHRNNNTLEQLAETLFRQWFVEEAQDSWEEVTLGSLCNKITKGTTPTTMGKPFVELGINFIKAESLNEVGGFIKNKFSFVDESTYDLLKRSQIKEGDILFTIAGTIGRTAIVTSSILPANTNQAVAIIRVDNEKINQTFMKYVMKSDYIKEIMETKIVHAVQPNLSLGEISDTKIKLPPKWKLDKFKLVGQNLQDKINHNNELIQQLENLRDTLLPKLMSGAVRVEN